MAFYENVEKNTVKNKAYRNVMYTGKFQQFVYMTLKPLDDIHMEIHKSTDQFIRIEKGVGIAIINNKKYKLYDGIGLIIPAGKKHQIINTSKTKELKLYSIYSPPEHKPKLKQMSNPDKKSSKKGSKRGNKRCSKKGSVKCLI
jgi:mannose-6-phosphate isomerase-like protein (cupin superfamily)